MQLRDLIELSGHRIQVLYGDERHLDREISSAYTTDLLDSSRYLTPGQLVMTGLMWHRTAADSETFVSVLAKAGVHAMVAGDALFGMVPDDVVQACRRHGMPLLSVPADVSFAEITERMADEAADDRVKRLTARMVRQRQLLTEVTEGKALDELVMQVSKETGLPAWIVTATGRSVVTGSGTLSGEDLDLIITAGLGAERLPTTVLRPGVDSAAGSPAFSVHAIGSISEPRVTSWFLAIGGDMTAWSFAVLDAIGELTAIAGLERARQESGLRAWHSITDRALANVENDSGRPESAVMLAQVGVNTAGPLVVVVAGFTDRPDLDAVARWLLTDAVTQFGIPVVGAGDDGSPVALISLPAGGSGAPTPGSLEPNPVAAALRRAFARITPALVGAQLSVGVSRPTPLAAAGGALRSARYSRLLGEKNDREPHVGSSEEVVSAVQLLTAIPDHLRQTFAIRILGAVVEHDQRNNADLMPTLRAFLDCSGSWSRTAAQLGLHLNTVRYRIARVQELTGRDLGDVADRTDVYLALQLL